MKGHLSCAEATAATDLTSLYDSCKVCPKSSHCCYRASTIVVLPNEAKMIIERVGSNEYLNTEANGIFTISKKAGEACPFLTVDGLCGIYDIRPTDCRSWPITFDRASARHQYVCDMGCPAVQENTLQSEFVEAAQRVLQQIDSNLRSCFVELVHRDALPLVPLRRNKGNGK